jgi:GDP-L-fucose synthase
VTAGDKLSVWKRKDVVVNNFYENKRVVVTGGYGFLGQAIANKLRLQKAIVIPLSRRNGCNLSDYYQAIYWFQTAKPDIVFNCAALQGGLGFQKTAPALIFSTNLAMNLYAMEAALQSGATKYINILASCAYPGKAKGLLHEDGLLDGPLHPTVRWYATPKRAAYIQSLAYREQYGFNAISVVLINLYGPREHFSPTRSHAMAALIRKFYEAKRDDLPSVEVWGTGNPVREWTYIDDAAEGVLKAGELYNEPEPLNVATGIGLSIAELANLIREVVDYPGQIVYDKSKPDGAPKKVADIRKMRRVLNWKPQMTLREGIKLTVNWLDENYDRVVQED